MRPLVQRVAECVCLNAPHALCFACLASQQGMREHDVRDAALVLVARAGLELARRVCNSCGHEDETIVSREAA
jgi:hypothetical protein